MDGCRITGTRLFPDRNTLAREPGMAKPKSGLPLFFERDPGATLCVDWGIAMSRRFRQSAHVPSLLLYAALGACFILAVVVAVVSRTP